MKKVVLVIGLLGACGYALSQTVVLNAVVAFIFAGVVPGTYTVLPFWAMSLILGTIAAIALHWLFKQPLFIGDISHREKQIKARARAEVIRSVSRQTAPSTVTSRRARRRYQSIVTSS